MEPDTGPKRMLERLRLRAKPLFHQVRSKSSHKNSSKVEGKQSRLLHKKMSASVPDIRQVPSPSCQRETLSSSHFYSTPSSPLNQPRKETEASVQLSEGFLAAPRAISNWPLHESTHRSLLEEQNSILETPEEMDVTRPVSRPTSELPLLEVSEDSTEVQSLNTVCFYSSLDIKGILKCIQQCNIS